MNKILSIALAAALVLSASAAYAGQTPILDEWAQPVLIEGAKGATVEAYQRAQFDGESLVGEVGSTEELFNSVTKWTTIRDFRDVGHLSGSDYLNLI